MGSTDIDLGSGVDGQVRTLHNVAGAVFARALGSDTRSVVPGEGQRRVGIGEMERNH
jgi:hypothetical protein